MREGPSKLKIFLSYASVFALFKGNANPENLKKKRFSVKKCQFIEICQAGQKLKKLQF